MHGHVILMFSTGYVFVHVHIDYFSGSDYFQRLLLLSNIVTLATHNS